MLFHAKHVHTAQTCPAGDADWLRATFGRMLGSASEFGVALLGVYADAPAHTVYLIIEAQSSEQLERLFEPLLGLGSAEIRPVTDARAAYERFLERASER